MVSRPTRRKALSDSERETFLQDITKAHYNLGRYTLALSPLGDEYKAVLALKLALQQAIHDVTSYDPDLAH